MNFNYLWLGFIQIYLSIYQCLCSLPCANMTELRINWSVMKSSLLVSQIFKSIYNLPEVNKIVTCYVKC